MDWWNKVEGIICENWLTECWWVLFRCFQAACFPTNAICLHSEVFLGPGKIIRLSYSWAVQGDTSHRCWLLVHQKLFAPRFAEPSHKYTDSTFHSLLLPPWCSSISYWFHFLSSESNLGHSIYNFYELFTMLWQSSRNSWFVLRILDRFYISLYTFLRTAVIVILSTRWSCLVLGFYLGKTILIYCYCF